MRNDKRTKLDFGNDFSFYQTGEALSGLEAEKTVRNLDLSHKIQVLSKMPQGVWQGLTWAERLNLRKKQLEESRPAHRAYRAQILNRLSSCGWMGRSGFCQGLPHLSPNLDPNLGIGVSVG